MENQGFYDVDEAAKNWFLVTAAKKWKDFKATLKKEFFDEKLTIEELLRKHGNRVKHTDWKFLIKHWTSPEFEVRSKIIIYAYLDYSTFAQYNNFYPRIEWKCAKLIVQS